MLLRSLKVERWRCFVEPFALGELPTGITVIHGPNGSGKSTLIQALRFALFESHRVGGEAVKRQLWPWGEEEAKRGPTVAVEFEEPGKPPRRWRLRKRFLKRPLASLKQFDGARFVEVSRGNDADEQARGFLLGTRAGRGLTREEHLGLARILWTTHQGELALSLGESEAQRPVLERLREVLAHTASASELTTLEAEVAVDAEKLVRRDGRPRAGTEWAELEARAEHLEAQLVPLRARLRDYERLAWEALAAERAHAEAQRELEQQTQRPTAKPCTQSAANESTLSATTTQAERPSLPAADAQRATGQLAQFTEQRDRAVERLEACLARFAEAVRSDEPDGLQRARAALEEALTAVRAAERAHAVAEVQAHVGQAPMPTTTPRPAASPLSTEAEPSARAACEVELARRAERAHEVRGRVKQLLAECPSSEAREGLYEQVQRLEVQLAQTRDRLRLARERALALVRLRETLDACRRERMQAVAAPLQDALNETLRRLGFRHAEEHTVTLDERSFSLAGLAPRTSPSRPVSMEELSEGEREQVYFALRLELARRVSTPEAPQVAVLDDTLTATDATRLPALLELLAEVAAQPLQVLLFTCHPERYTHLDAHTIELAARHA